MPFILRIMPQMIINFFFLKLYLHLKIKYRIFQANTLK